MNPQQQLLIKEATTSLDAARLLRKGGFYGFSASRAYYAMFYAAEAILLSKDLTFSKHAGVISAFGKRGYLLDSTDHYLLWLTSKWNGTGSTCTACCASR